MLVFLPWFLGPYLVTPEHGTAFNACWTKDGRGCWHTALLPHSVLCASLCPLTWSECALFLFCADSLLLWGILLPPPRVPCTHCSKEEGRISGCGRPCWGAEIGGWTSCQLSRRPSVYGALSKLIWPLDFPCWGLKFPLPALSGRSLAPVSHQLLASHSLSAPLTPAVLQGMCFLHYPF